MRCRLILLITEHPIQQGIRKGGGPYFFYLFFYYYHCIVGRVLFNGVSPLVVCFENILVRRPVTSLVRCDQSLEASGTRAKTSAISCVCLYLRL